MSDTYSYSTDQPDEELYAEVDGLDTPATDVPPAEEHIATPKQRRPLPLADIVTVLALFALVLAGYQLRSIGRNWDDYTQLHPDERFLTDVASTIRTGPRMIPAQRPDISIPEQFQTCYGVSRDEYNRMSNAERFAAREALGRGGYFDALCSELNPNVVKETIFVYGSYPLFSMRTLAETYSSVTDESHWTSYFSIRLVGRAMNSVFDTLVILLVFLIGARLFNRWVGLVAALFYTFATFPIQQSHFWTADAFTAFWVVLGIYYAVRALDNASSFRERFSALPWLGIGVAIWLVDMQSTEAVLISTPFLYIGIFLSVGLLNTLAIDQRQPIYAVVGTAAGLAALGLMYVIGGTDSITLTAVAIASISLIALSALWTVGYHRFAGYTDWWVWLASAFSLWVYDSLAHYGYDPESFQFIAPQIDLLAGYVLLFTAAGLLASGIRYVLFTRHQYQGLALPLVLAIGVPFFVAWGGLVLLLGGVSFWGIVAALVLAAGIAAATIFGMQDEVAFGLAFGAALAGRVNIAPLVGVLLLAILIRALPLVLEWRMYRMERNFRATRLATALILAGIATLVAFRFLQPHAFNGPNVLGVLGLNELWVADISEARRLVSGEVEIPPNWQWTNRTPWLYPLQNIVLYGVGWPLGLAGVAGTLWAFGRILRGKTDWTRLAIPVAWIVVYFGWLGQNWVTTMRYFMPIYGVLVLLAAWLLFEFGKMAYRWQQRVPLAMQPRLALGASALLTLFIAGYTMLYGYGFVDNVLNKQMTRVAASRYAMEFIPGDFGLYIDGDDGNTRMVNVSVYNAFGGPANIQTMQDGDVLSQVLAPPRTVNLTDVTLNLLKDVSGDEDNERVRVTVWAIDGSGNEQLLGAQLIDEDLNDPFMPYGQDYTVTFDPAVPLFVDPGSVPGSYEIRVELLRGGPVTLSANISDPLANGAISHLTVVYADPSGEPDVLLQPESVMFEQPEAYRDVAYFGAGTVNSIIFVANYTGEINRMVVPHVSDPFNDADDETLRVTLISQDLRVSGEVTGNFNTADDGHNLFGPMVEIVLDQPFPVEVDQAYTLEIQPLDFVGIAGSAVAWEGPWDDPMPAVVCPVPNGELYRDDLPSGMCTLTTDGVNLYNWHYIGLTMMMHWDDEPDKRTVTLDILNQTDYIFIGSNRFYDSFNRIPSRWPMSNDYYDALFSGELGFELEKVFTSYSSVGPFEWPDQVLPSDDLPNWRNELEAEEAFHVYTHPAVFVFKKTEAYTPENAERILGTNLNAAEDASPILWWQIGTATTNIVNRLRWGALPATASPNALQFTDAEQEIQTSGGTWSDTFNRDALQNRSQVFGLALWWGTMLLMGWFTFPLLHWIMPGLPDRGYAMGKLLGWLVVAWVAWFGASLRFEIWTQSWLTILVLAWFALNAIIAVVRWQSLRAFIAEKWRHLLIIELITFAMFIAFVGVRLGNPDLWHSPFGGEKPMNVAYFNAVLRSTMFPPIDPWYSGGYINYYYWGYVLVGAPTKMLGIMPSFAYNLIIPTIFAWTAMGAFSVAYNLVQSSRERRVEQARVQKPAREKNGPLGNAYVAGIVALMLAVVLGNLGSLRVLNTAVTRAGGWDGPAAYEQQALDISLIEFRAQTGREPTPEEFEDLQSDVVLSNLEATQKWFSAVWDGMDALGSGEVALSSTMAFHRWYWAPTRIIAELPDGAGHNAINEMPYFTFLYGDLHAHMMAMPVTLLAILFLTGEILGAGRRLRNALGAMVALLLLGMSVGLLRAINTWDWPTYMVLTFFGLTFAAWVGQRRLRTEVEPSPLLTRLRQYLDVRMMLRVWWLSGFLIIGAVAYSVFFVVEARNYDTRLANGEIPPICTELPPESIVPEFCEGNLEPEFSFGSLLVVSGGALGAVVFLYVAALVILGNRFTQDAIAVWIGRLALFGGASVIAIWPYMERFASAYGEILPWEADKTPLWAYLNIHGVFLFIIVSMLVWQTARWLRNHTVADLRGLSVPVLTVLGVIAVTPFLVLALGVLGDYAVFIVALPLFIWLSVLFLLPDQSQIERWVYVMIGLALGLTMAVEVVVLQGDIGRQNTVFKIYIQVWLLFSIASGVSLSWMMQSIERWMPSLSSVWLAGVVTLLSVAMLYPITATLARFEDRMNASETPLTLDGMAFMEVAPHGETAYRQENGVWFNLNGDYHMIRWMQDTIEGSPTIIEAQHPEQYHWGSRISIHTGLPTVFGWHFHQTQQRNLVNFDRLVATRFNNVQAFYETTDVEEAWEIIEFYNIEYIVVGTLERILYEDVLPPSLDSDELRRNQSGGIAKFDRMVELGLLEVAYERPTCVHPNIRDIPDCPPDRLSTDLVYRVVEGVDFDQTSVVRVAE